MKKNVVVGIIIIVLIISLVIIFYQEKNCDDFEDVYDMVGCYAQKALNSNNATICESIPSIVSRGSFIAECYKQYALETLDSKYCKAKWSLSIAAECAYEIAVKTDNATHCENAGGEMFRPYLQRNNCYTKFAVLKKDDSFCEELTEKIGIIDCYIQVDNNDYSVCENIKDLSYRNYCYWAFATFNEDSSVCQYIQENTKKEDCYEKIE